ncbi:MAG: polyprenyl synthetase family protein [Treponema sp.]|nr:polyprenyl synthetase family protein [Treponema sp.]
MGDFWSDFPGMDTAIMAVSDYIHTATASSNPIIQEALSGLFHNPGKMLRPGMLILASQFGNPDPKKIYPLAAAIEMLHTATLIHDDVIDDSPLRRGLPAVHINYGKKDAVLFGDFLLSRCFLVAAEYTNPQNAVNLGKVISVICSMELNQDADRYRPSTSIRLYLQKIIGKTALLFSLACHVGASEAKAPAQITERLRRIGYNIGMAFQIIDDILDYTGNETELKKPVGNDIRAGLVTLPLICALRQDKDGKLRELVRSELFPNSDYNLILATTRDLGGIEAARSFAHRYTERALREIYKLPHGPAKENMERLAKRLLVRTY